MLVGVARMKSFRDPVEIITSSHFDFNFPEARWQRISGGKTPFRDFPGRPKIRRPIHARPREVALFPGI